MLACMQATDGATPRLILYAIVTCRRIINLTGKYTTSGPLFGTQLGYNIALQSFLVGVEGDFSFAGIEGDKFFEGKFADQTIASELDWLATARVRGGVLVEPNTLIYATGGLAWGKWKNEFLPGSTWNSWSDIRKGYVIGGGVERKLADDFSVRLEYTYTDFGGKSEQWTDVSDFFLGPVTSSGSIKFDHEIHAVRVGFNAMLR